MRSRRSSVETTTKVLSAKLAASQPLSKGEFEGIILCDPPEGDADNERLPLENIFQGKSELTLPLRYHHVDSDPLAVIGTVTLRPDPPRSIFVRGKLDLDNPLADVAYERLLLPEDDPKAARQMSVGYLWSQRVKDENGVYVVQDPEFREVSLVVAGAQQTLVTAVKAAKEEIDEALTELTEEPEGEFETKAGRTISAKNEQRFRDSIGEVRNAIGRLEDELNSLVELSTPAVRTGDKADEPEAKAEDRPLLTQLREEWAALTAQS
jgi:HK97 family phage prohead protease